MKRRRALEFLTNLFMKRDDVVRSLHPTHSMAGSKRCSFVPAGEENCIHLAHLVDAMTD